MKKPILLTGGVLLDPFSGYQFQRKDILIKGGLIAEISDEIEGDGCQVISVKDEIISPGWIDIHSHVFQKKTSLGMNADEAGVRSGVTALFDAGSAGADNFECFRREVVWESKTRVYSFLNLASNGLEQERYELADLKNIDPIALEKVYHANSNLIKGIKVRASASTVGELGIKPVAMGKEIAIGLKLPLIVHIGNFPPYIEEVLALLDKGDVITHCFHGKANGLLQEDGTLKPEVLLAKERGVSFDIGHGTSSFNFQVAAKAMEQNLVPDMISTDIYRQNYEGPVYSLSMTINKMMAFGMTVEACIKRVTAVPALHFRLDGIGLLKPGLYADLTLFKIIKEPVKLLDSDGNWMEGSQYLKVTRSLIEGESIPLGDPRRGLFQDGV